MSVKHKFDIFEKKMYDILMILVDFLWKFSKILADFLLPGSVSDPDPADQNETDPDPQHC